MTVDWYVLRADGTYYPRAGVYRGKTDPGVDFKIAQDTVNAPDGAEFHVSTVFLGLDHQYGSGPPLVFETMIFPSENGDISDWGEVWADRYSTIDEAREGHAKAMQVVRDGELGGEA